MRELLRSRALWAMVGAGLALRLWLAFDWFGFEGDMLALEMVGDQLGSDPLGVYSVLNPGIEVDDYTLRRWPYPPGFFAWVVVANGGEQIGLPFHATVSVLPILCEVGIALAAYAYLGLRGAAERIRLAAAALVLFGPSFFGVTGFHGQIDAAAIFPAVLALIAWERLGSGDRALWAGALIGAGALIKWVPLLLVLALLPSARSWREALTLLVVPALIVAVAVLPWFVADPNGVSNGFGYAGVPGAGGLSLIAQPELSTAFLEKDFEVLKDLNGANEFLNAHSSKLVLVALAGLGAFFWRMRPSPVDAAAMLWLVVFIANPNFSFQYAIWGIPFLLLAGYLRAAYLFELVLVLPVVFWYDAFGLAADGAELYPVFLTVLFILWVVGVVWLGRRIVLGRRANPDGDLEPLVGYGPGGAPTSAL